MLNKLFKLSSTLAIITAMLSYKLMKYTFKWYEKISNR